MIILPMVSAELGTFKQNKCVELKTILNGTSWVNLSTVSYPNSTIIFINEEMTQNGPSYNYTFCNTDSIGVYVYDYYDDLGNIYSNDFIIAYLGQRLTTSNSIIYLIMFLVIFFVFGMVMFFISQLPSDNDKDPEGKLLSISYLKYLRSGLWFVEWILFIGILYLSSNLAFAYLGEQLFAKTLFVLFRIAFGVTPVIVIVWIAWFFVKIFHDKQLQNMLNRGFFPEGKI